MTGKISDIAATVSALAAGMKMEVEKADGTSAKIDGANMGAGGFMGALLSPIATQSGTGFTTQVNAGTATFVDGSVGIVITNPNPGTSNVARGLKQAVPSTPYSKIFTGLTSDWHTSELSFAAGWIDASNKLDLLVHRSDGTPTIQHYTFSDPNTRVGNTSIRNYDVRPTIFRLRDDGTTVYMDYSFDGTTFNVAYSVAKSSGYLGSSGYSNFFFGTVSYNTAGAATLCAFL